MRQTLLPATLLGLSLLGAAVAFPPAASAQVTLRLDKSHQEIRFQAGHLGFAPVYGRFREADATLVLDEANPEGARVTATLNAASVDTDHQARDQHLRSADFLDAEAHPTITFTSTAVTLEPPGDDTAGAVGRRGTLTGDLTLRGVTRPVTLAFEILNDAPFPLPGYHNVRTVAVRATGTIQRSAFGMDYALDLVPDAVEVTLVFDMVDCSGAAAQAPSCTYGR